MSFENDPWSDISIQDDAFGPGFDLVLSLLAVAILLLGIVGAGERLLPITDANEPTQAQNDASQIDETTPDPPPQPDPRIAELTATVREQDAMIRRLASLAQEPAAAETLGVYSVDTRELVQALSGRTPPVNPAIVTDVVSKLRPSAPAPERALEIIIQTEIPPALSGRLNRSLSAEEALAAMYRASAELAFAYQAALAKAGAPLACIRMEPGGYAQAPGVRGALTRGSDNLDGILELRTFFATISDEELARNRSSLTFRIKATQAPECNPKSYLR